MTRILIADDHEVIRRGLRQMIERHPGWEVCGEAAAGPESFERAKVLKPDVMILDISMPGTDSVELTRWVRTNLPETEILIFTMHEGEEMIRTLIGAGARGYILKSDPTGEILAAIEALSNHLPFFTGKASAALREAFLKIISKDQGHPPPPVLSAREREIVQLLAEGKSNKRVAASLGISVKTVETHRAAIMHKLNASSIVELVHYAVRNNIIAT